MYVPFVPLANCQTLLVGNLGVPIQKNEKCSFDKNQDLIQVLGHQFEDIGDPIISLELKNRVLPCFWQVILVYGV